MNRTGITFWNIKDDRVNGQPTTSLKTKADMVWLRGKLACTAVKFKEMVGDFTPLAAYLSSSKNRYWMSDLIEVTIARSENDEILIEFHQKADPDQNNPSITFGFEKPEIWTDQIQLEIYCASGKSREEIASFGELLPLEWPNCHKSRYRKILWPETH